MKTPRKPFLILLLTTVLALLVTSPSHAANWPHWRGPHFDGSTDETGLPETFSKTENVKWVTELPGPSASTPVIWGNYVFFTSVDSKRKRLVAMAVHRKTGAIMWSKDVGHRVNRDNRSNFASPSPVTDGELVHFFFGDANLVTYDFSGNKIWERNIEKDYGEFAFLWSFSTSPTLHDGKLIMQVLQRDTAVQGRGNRTGKNDSYVLALHPKTGRELWKVVRPSEARAESLEAFSTPVPVRSNGREELLVVGGDCITGHDPKTGKELWRWGTWNPNRITHWRLVPSPAIGDGMALACGPKGAPIFAIKLGQNGTLPEDGYAWKSPDSLISADVATPLFYKGHFFVLNGNKQVLAKIEPKTGRAKWIGEIDARPKIESSPTAGDGKIYFMNFKGEVFVVDAGDSFKVLHKAEMGDPEDNDLRSSISISQGNLFIRTGSKLYCIGK